MLDVDGNVVGPDDLVNRVEHLIAAINAGGPTPGAADPDGLPAVVAPIHAMRAAHRTVQPPDVAGGAGSIVKKIVRRLTSWYVEPRWNAEQELDARTIDFASETYNNLHRIESELEGLRRQNVRLRLELVGSVERFRRAQEEIGVLSAAVADQAEALRGAAMQSEVRALGKEVESLLGRLGAESTQGVELDYVEFERRFRGAGADIIEGQRRYLSLFPPPGIPEPIVDIGCGSGEMLELLTKEGHECIGVDTDAGMIAECAAKGLTAIQDDGLHFLAQTRPESLKGIFCAQVVEHLLTTELEELVRLSHRALQTDGTLVMETINPRSSYALGNHYYADTSHVRPVHPETLRYICEQLGFRNVQMEERSPHPALELIGDLPSTPEGDAVRTLLLNVFGYQDYVVVATK
jgi:2-polyprenyl-3-methyl-5-hydroxy-6-metoxy-1,4-benzoquinol methylase